MKRRNPVSEVTREHAHNLRQHATQPERKLWRCLRNRQLAGLKFVRQVPIGKFIVDFLCRERRLIVEVDGDSHTDRAEYDRRRQIEIERDGFRIVRVSNDDVLSNIEGVLAVVVSSAGIDVERWQAGEFGRIDNVR